MNTPSDPKDTVRWVIVAVLACGLLILGYAYFSASRENERLVSETETYEQELSNSRDKINEQSQEITRFQLTVKHQEEDIERLREDVAEKQREVSRREEDIRDLEKKNDGLLEQLNAALTTGGPPEIRRLVDRLKNEIQDTRRQRDSIREERNALVLEFNQLQETLVERERELEFLKKSTLPAMEDQILTLQQQVATQQRVLQVTKVRADPQDIRIDTENNTFAFEMTFDEESYRILRRLDLREVTFAPLVVNKESDLYFIPQGNDFARFSTENLPQTVSIRFVVDNIDLQRSYRRRNAVNFDKGDPMRLEVQIPELDGHSLLRTEFRLR